jgi:hypothetical protein
VSGLVATALCDRYRPPRRADRIPESGRSDRGIERSHIPLTLVALGIIVRGGAFAFRKASDHSTVSGCSAPRSRCPR